MQKIKKFDVLGVRLDLISRKEIFSEIDNFFNTRSFHYIVTPNPEIVLQAQKDSDYKKILNLADLSLADGVGVIWAGKLHGVKIPRHTGSGLTPDLLKIAEKKVLKTMVLNLKDGLSDAEEIESSVSKLFPKLNVKSLDVSKGTHLLSDDFSKIKKFSPNLVFLTLGSPTQEKLAVLEIGKISSVCLAVCVGGSFDILTRKAKKPPKIIKNIGLEWLWRTINNPRRFKRLITTIPSFIFLVLKERITGK